MTTPFDPPPGTRPIRITREDTLSRHVDDLLQRQRSLRGQPIAPGERSGPWYFRNWAMLAIAGYLGAFAAWALIEPAFDDSHFIRGRIEEIGDQPPAQVHISDPEVRFLGTVLLDRTPIWLPAGTKATRSDGTTSPFSLTELSVGEEIGVYTEYEEVEGIGGVGIARLVVMPPVSASGAARASDLHALHWRSTVAGFLLFPVVAALVGLTIGGVDGVVCRLPRRALLAGGVGLLVGLLGGLFSGLLAGAVYMPLSGLAAKWMHGGSLSGLGFLLQVVGRSLAWALAGTTMGLGQGIALRSKRLLAFGFIGGIVGGLIGGLLFDPIDLVLLGPDKPSAHWSRLIGLTVIGTCVGGMIGVVELLARDAWLRMTEGPLAGKEFLIFKDVMRIGSSSQSDIYLFNDPQVAAHHATLRAVGDECEIENHSSRQPTLINGRPVGRNRLHHGDQITIGRASFVFQRRRG